jgi:hypothetical protein
MERGYAIIPPFETEEQIRSHRLAFRLVFSVLAINIISVFLSGFNRGWELLKWATMACSLFHAPAMVSWSNKKEREGRRKVLASEALDESWEQWKM